MKKKASPTFKPSSQKIKIGSKERKLIISENMCQKKTNKGYNNNCSSTLSHNSNCSTSKSPASNVLQVEESSPEILRTSPPSHNSRRHSPSPDARSIHPAKMNQKEIKDLTAEFKVVETCLPVTKQEKGMKVLTAECFLSQLSLWRMNFLFHLMQSSILIHCNAVIV